MKNEEEKRKITVSKSEKRKKKMEVLGSSLLWESLLFNW